MNCRHTYKIQEYLEEMLSEKETVFLNNHIQTCADCQDELRTMKQIFTELTALKNSFSMNLQENLSSVIMKNIKVEKPPARGIPLPFLAAFLLLLDVAFVLIIRTTNLGLSAGNFIGFIFLFMNLIRTTLHVLAVVIVSFGMLIKNQMDHNFVFYIVLETCLFFFCFAFAWIFGQKKAAPPFKEV